MASQLLDTIKKNLGEPPTFQSDLIQRIKTNLGEEPPTSAYVSMAEEVLTQIPAGIARGVINLGAFGSYPIARLGELIPGAEEYGLSRKGIEASRKELIEKDLPSLGLGRPTTLPGEAVGGLAEFIPSAIAFGGPAKAGVSAGARALKSGSRLAGVAESVIPSATAFGGAEAVSIRQELDEGKITLSDYLQRIGIGAGLGATLGGIGKLPLREVTKFPLEVGAFTEASALQRKEVTPTKEDALYSLIFLGGLKGLQAGVQRLAQRTGKPVEQVQQEVAQEAKETNKSEQQVVVDNLKTSIPKERKEMPRAETQGPQGQEVLKPVEPRAVESTTPIQPEAPPPPPSALGIEPQPGTTELPGATPSVDVKTSGAAALPRAGEGVTPQPLSKAEPPAEKRQRDLQDFIERQGEMGGGEVPPIPPKGPSALGGEPPKPEDVVKSRISFEASKQPGISVGEKFDNFWTAIKDQFRPIQNAVFDIAGKEKPLPPEADPYILARLNQGWWGKADTFLNRGTFDYEKGAVEFTHKGLKDILTPIRNDMQDFSAYLIARAVPARESLGKTTGITLETAKATLESLEKKYPNFKEVASQVQGFQKKVLEYYRKAGFIDKETEALFNKLYESYVPFYREILEEATGPFAGRGLSNIPQAIKRAKGSERTIVDPLESIIKNTYAMINVAERNRVVKALTDLADKPNAEKWIKKVPPDVRPVAQVSAKEMAQKIADALGMTREEIGLADDKLVTIFRPTKTEGQIWVWKEGKKEYYDVEPTLYKALQSLDSQSSGMLIKMLSFPAKLLRAGATLSPEFIARNPIRDAFTAMVYSKYGFIPGVDTMRGLFHTIGKTDTYYQWKASGAEHSMLVSLDREYLQGNLKDLMRSNIGQLKNVVTRPLEMLRIFSELMETTTRVGEFAKGIKKEGLTPQGLTKAGFASREVTLDFARIGPQGKAINAIVAFFNAQVEGLDKMKRAFIENPARTTTLAVAGITLPSVLLWFANKDNERVQNLPQWQKDLFWIIDTGTVIIRIPKPFELGIIFGTAPERALDWVAKNDPTALAKIKDSIIRGATPGIVPTAAQPLVDIYANKSMFLDRPIVPRGKENLEPYLQTTPGTSETAKMLGTALNYSPAKIETLIQGYTGGLGRMGLEATDKALQLVGKTPEISEPSKTVADIPVIRAFVSRYPTINTEPSEDFYKLYNKAVTNMQTFKSLVRTGKIEEARRYAQENLDGLTQYELLNTVNDTLKKHREAIHALEGSKVLSSEEKRQNIDKLIIQMNKITNLSLNRIRSRKGLGHAELGQR